MDELDKTSQSRFGDPQAALLEILDPEQNAHFIDRYLEFPVDLSNVLFICTANEIDNVHYALKDRMDVIEFKEYSESQRQTIAREYLIPKIIKHYSLEKYPIILKEEVIDKVCKIKQLRQIEKKLRKMYRMAAVDIYLNGKSQQVIDLNYISKLTQQNIQQAIGFNNATR